MRNPFSDLTRFERALWLSSMTLIALSSLLAGGGDALSLVSSLVGVTSLIFIAKGYVLGQALMLVFALLYGVVSFDLRYYGEMITYLGMTAPTAFLTMLAWIRHPFQGTREVEVSRLRQGHWIAGGALTIVVTAAFYFILAALGNANLPVSTLSVATSFIASYLTYLRSPYYAIGYALNDLVLVILWGMATLENAAYLPMTVCFAVFFANDLYGFAQWQRMQKRQSLARP